MIRVSIVILGFLLALGSMKQVVGKPLNLTTQEYSIDQTESNLNKDLGMTAASSHLIARIFLNCASFAEFFKQACGCKFRTVVIIIAINGARDWFYYSKW